MLKLWGNLSLLAAVSIAPLATAAAATPALARAIDVPLPLKHLADCMYKALKTVPGVSEPRLGYVTSDGSTYPYLEYRASEVNSWVNPTRVWARKADDGTYWFEAYLPGAISPDIGHIDTHVTDAIARKWKAQCKVDTIVKLD